MATTVNQNIQPGRVAFNGTPGECNAIDTADFGSPLSGQTIAASGDFDWYCFSAN